MPADRYVSPVGPSRHEVEIRRSRFIACLFPVCLLYTSDAADD